MSSGRFIEYTLDRPDVQRAWQDFTHHDFVKGMGRGNLPLERFKAYLVQDYLYLVRAIKIRHASITDVLMISGPICSKQCVGIIQSQDYGFDRGGKSCLFMLRYQL